MKTLCCMLIALALVTGSCSPPKKEAATPEQTAKYERKMEEARGKLKEAAKMGLLKNLDYNGPEPLVVVGSMFYSLPYSAKQGFATTVNDFLVCGEDKYINYPIRDYRTNKIIATYKYGELTVK